MKQAKLNVVHFNSEDVIATSGNSFKIPDGKYCGGYFVTGQPEGTRLPTSYFDEDHDHHNGNEKDYPYVEFMDDNYYWDGENATIFSSMGSQFPELNKWYDLIMDEDDFIYWYISPAQ